MADFNALEALINAHIKKNGVQAITGNILNGILRGMVAALGKGYTIAGSASPATDPGTMTGPLAYIAYTAGTYTHFGGLEVEQGEVAMLIYNEAEWHKEVLFSLAASATIDGNVGTPEVGVSFVDGQLTFDFRNMKGNPGDPAGFGTVNATVDGQSGTPSVSVQSSGPDTAKNFTFAFTGLKGETGVTSVVATVDNTSGTPSCAVSLQGQQLTLAFTGLKGAQGNTGVSADYPIAIINNLTTDDPASALSAAQGVVLDGKVSQLEANWKLPDTVVSGMKTGYISTYGNYSSAVESSATTRCYDLVVSPGQVYDIYGTAGNNNYYRIYAIFKEDGTRIERDATSGDYTVTPKRVTIPENGYHLVINLTSYNSATDKVMLIGEVVDAENFQKQIDEANSEIDAADTTYEFQEENRQASDIYSPILVDWMQMCHQVNYMDSLAYMSVISSTEDSITLTQAEAESFYPGYKTPAVVGFLDGSYKVVYFNGYSGSGDVITRADFDDTDLTNAKTVQSLHDTVRDGHGIHLTPSGYLALGQFTAEELVKRESQKNDNLIAGANFFFCSAVSVEKQKKNIIESYGRVVCVAERSFGDKTTASGMPGGSLQSFGINTTAIQAYADCGGWCRICYYMACIGNTQWNKLAFKARGRGFIELQASLIPNTTTPKYTGTADAEIIVDGVTVQTITLKYFQTRYQINGITAKEKIEIKIKNTSANPTYVLVSSFNFWRMTERVDVPSLSGKKIAVLGDSWTQFPNPQTALSDHESFNNDVVMPNGEVHTGSYGYFPKELARVTGATVDNWGKSNMRADNWGIPMIDELLAYTNYDYVLVEYFINDGNAGIPLKDWASNIKKICKRIIANGARPILILPCRMNGDTAYTDYHEYLMRGLMNLP